MDLPGKCHRFRLEYLFYWIFVILAVNISASASVNNSQDLSMMPPSILSSAHIHELFDHFETVELPPDFTPTVTIVDVSLYVNSFDSVNEVSMDYRLDLHLRMTWSDQRLVIPSSITELTRVELNYHFLERIWKPDVYFVNEKEATMHDVTEKNELVHIYQNGTVLYSARLSLTLSCPMKLRRYPHDRQQCPIKLSIFGYTDDLVRIKWRSYDPIIFNTDIQLAKFVLNHYPVSNECTIDFGVVGKFTCIMATILLEREFGYYFIQIYLPTVLIVCLSWISFWLPPEATPARVSIGLITVLTMATERAKSRESLPHVSYITAMDLWMSVNTGFVFAAMLEFAVVNVMKRKFDNETKPDPQVEFNANKIIKCGKSCNFNERINLDFISSIVFPISYIIFSLFYWLTFLTQ